MKSPGIHNLVLVSHCQGNRSWISLILEHHIHVRFGRSNLVDFPWALKALRARLRMVEGKPRVPLVKKAIDAIRPHSESGKRFYLGPSTIGFEATPFVDRILCLCLRPT